MITAAIAYISFETEALIAYPHESGNKHIWSYALIS